MEQRARDRQLGQELIAEGWLTTAQLCAAADCSSHTPAKLRNEGLIEAQRVPVNGATSFLYHPDSIRPLREHMKRPGSRRKLQRRKSIDGVPHLSCTKCDEFKPEEEFGLHSGDVHRTSSGRATRCGDCERQRSLEYYHRNPKKNIEKVTATTRERRTRLRAKGKRLMDEWRATEVSAEAVLDAIMDSLDINDTPHNACASAGVHPDSIRALTRRQTISMERADFLLSKFDLPEVAEKLIPPPPTMEDWSRDHDCCVVCGTIEIHHQARGACNACYHRVRVGLPPRPANEWSLIFHCCQRCGTDERKHASRGLCTTCWYHVQRNGQTDQYETITAAKKRMASTAEWAKTSALLKAP